MTNMDKRKWRQSQFWNWTPVLVWMTVIFLLSSDYFSAASTTPLIARFLFALFPHLADFHVENAVSVIRKLGHLSEYFILAVLIMRAIQGQLTGQTAKPLILWSISLTVIYAVSDELHQFFVPSRTASLHDVIIDAAGGIMGTLWFHLRNGGKR